MKFGKINKKFLAGSLAFALTLTGCHSYKKNEDGEVYLDGTISYDDLSDYKLIEMSTLAGAKLYITKFSSDSYYDVFTGLELFNMNDKETSNSLINEYKLGDYLVALNELKSEYNADDLKKVLSHINEEYKFESEKVK